MAGKTARTWESEIRTALRDLPAEGRAATVGLYTLMRFDFEDKFWAAESSAESRAALKLPLHRPTELAGRETASVAACLSRLKATHAGPERFPHPLVVEVETEGYDLPGVRRICEIHARDRGYKAPAGRNPDGVRNSDGVGVRNSDPKGSEVGFGTPPMVSSPPITPSSSLPPSHTHRARGAPTPSPSADGDDLDGKLRAFIGGHRMLNYSAKGHGIARQMVESGGWNGMVLALDEAIAQGAAEPFSYAKRVMASHQAKQRIGGGKPTPPAAKPLTKAKVYH